MHLKKISINGFKSFADKVELDIDKGVTGIVGPNGSGKSNVIDSVRWVMGEQNAKTLRGEKGTDIIFAGSASRKSLSMAEVSLVFDNSDSSAFCPPEYQHDEEITLTRRIYADGQRDYLINSKPARLKDIVGFFTATGLGGRSYSMIQQGQVDRILNAKPEDVREILEEAAGTAVFKSRRVEAERRLLATSENLARVEDILREIDKQKKTLKAQADKARVYKDLATELKERELYYLAYNFKRHNDDKIKFESIISDNQRLEAEAMTEIAILEQDLAVLQEKLSESDPHLRELQEKISRVREDIARAENTIANSESKISENQLRLSNLAVEIEEDQTDLEVIEKQFEAALEEVELALSESKLLQEQIDSVQGEADHIDEKADVLNSKIEDFDDEVSNINRLIESNKLRQEAILKEAKNYESEKSEQRKRVESLEEDYAQLQILLEGAQVRVAAERKGLDKDILNKQTLQKQIEDNQIAIKESQSKLSLAKENHIGLKTRLQSLVEMQAQSGACANAVAKFTEAGILQEVCLGMFTDFVELSPKFSELGPSAQAAIEKWSERLLVKDWPQFSSLVRTAHELRLGDFSVSFLDNDAKIVNEDILSWSKKYEAECLDDIFKIKKKTSGIEVLLKSIYYIPSLVIDPEAIKSIPVGTTLITASGIYCSAQTNQFVVASLDQANNFIRLGEKIEQLQKQLKVCEQTVAAARTEVDRFEESLQHDTQKYKELDEYLQSQNKGVLSVLTEFENLRQQEEFKQELLTTARNQLLNLDTKSGDLVVETERLKQNSIELQDELKNVFKERDLLLEQLEEIEENKKSFWAGHGDKRIELAKKQTRAQALQEGYNQTKSQLERLQASLQKKLEEKTRMELAIEQTRVAFSSAQNDIQKLLLDREAFENEYASKRESNADIIEEQRQLDAKLKKYRDKQADYNKKINESQIKLERALIANESNQEQALEKYQIQISDYQIEMRDNYETEEEGKEISKLRARLEKVGPINMMAIEEFDALSEREDFILKQREEILRSIELIKEAITEIEVTSKDKFMVVFHTINEEFGNLFPILFPTGEAFLKLSDPEDTLNSGIEIMCRLPGKKMQRLSLFSGGEKALTAIALIFALLKTKPTPFCFLDEVDAPLDEANVVRYNKVLTALAKRFQFIIITHNRRTMEILDTLYGVTMQEPGVSKVVGVDMSKDIPTHLQSAFKRTATEANQPAH